MNILAFGASNSKNSINKVFAKYTAEFFEYNNLDYPDLNDFPLPIYSIDLEKENGIPDPVINFYDKIQSADIIIISLTEHNGSYSAVFKNLIDWLSRYQSKFFENKKLVLVSTAPGARGGRGVMDAALIRFPIHGANILGYFCLPKFQDNFKDKIGISDTHLKLEFQNFINDCKSRV